MHEFVNYSEEEQKEFRARVRWLKHEWQMGDWLYEEEFGEVHLVINADRHHLEVYGNGSHLADREETWLPTLDDLVRMEGWEFDFHLTKTNRQHHLGSEAEEWMIHDDETSIAMAPHPCLAALRAIQRCDVLCEEETAEWPAAGGSPERVRCYGPCAGIHGPDGPHFCLEHLDQT